MSRDIDPEELKRLFPRASLATIKANSKPFSGVASDSAQPGTAGRIVSVMESPVVTPACDPGLIKIAESTDEERLNKNEKAYLAWLRTQNDYWIGIQNITLKLGFDLRYTPDFAALDGEGMRLIDCKGVKKDGTILCWEDSKIKMKVAARVFPMFRFVIAYKDKGIWHHADIKP